jgi:hypothetical protein
MKNLKYLTIIVSVFLLTITACQEEDQEFGDVIAPSNLTVDFEIQGQDASNLNGDGSGFVTFTASAENAITYRFNFGDGTDIVVEPSGTVKHRFNLTGTNTYNVAIIASGTGGVPTSLAVSLDVFSAFDDQEAKDLLSGGVGLSKIWYPKLDQNGHLGVGPTLEQDIADDSNLNGHWFPQYDSTNAFGKCDDAETDCFCDFSLMFSLSADNSLTFAQINNGNTFFNWANGDVVGQTFGQFEDTCFAFDTSGEYNVAFAPSSTDWSQVADPDFLIPRGTVMNFSNDAFMGYYTGVSSYEILIVEEDYLYVRFYDNANPVLAWYQMFTTTDPNNLIGGDCAGGDTGNTGSGNNDVLVWADEFDENGAPCSDNWTYDIGTGSGGWGNNESQYYTDSPENVIVEDGFLKITAKAEAFQGSNYTSSRLKSENLFEFTYGRVEVRAKLPTGAGTWPAIWMLGADYDTNTWPACGEVDIMEHVGNSQNEIHSTLHYPGNSGANGNGNSIQLPNVSSEFKIYEVEWTPTNITFTADGNVVHTFTNSASTTFNSDFFFILNVAMGGNFGGTIDSGFTQSTLEIDYIRVYQ